MHKYLGSREEMNITQNGIPMAFFFFFLLNKRILFQHYKTAKQVVSIIIKHNTGEANSNVKKAKNSSRQWTI